MSAFLKPAGRPCPRPTLIDWSRRMAAVAGLFTALFVSTAVVALFAQPLSPVLA